MVSHTFCLFTWEWEWLILFRVLRQVQLTHNMLEQSESCGYLVYCLYLSLPWLPVSLMTRRLRLKLKAHLALKTDGGSKCLLSRFAILKIRTSFFVTYTRLHHLLSLTFKLNIASEPVLAVSLEALLSGYKAWSRTVLGCQTRQISHVDLFLKTHLECISG